MLTWFPVHPVSMNNTNRLLTSDNKGVAQQWVEKRWPTQQEDLEPDFTAAFAQSNSEWCSSSLAWWEGPAGCGVHQRNRAEH